MRAKPRTRFQWMELACQAAGAIQKSTCDRDLAELALAIQIMLGAPSAIRTGMFDKIDRLIDKVNGVEYESIGAKAIREFDERARP